MLKQDNSSRTWQPFLWWNPTTTICSTGPFTSSLPWDSIPTPKPMSGLRRTALASERGHHSEQKQIFPSYCESMCPKQTGTVITRPQLRSLPPRPTALNVTCVERVLHVLPRSSFTSSTTRATTFSYFCKNDIQPHKLLWWEYIKNFVFNGQINYDILKTEL